MLAIDAGRTLSSATSSRVACCRQWELFDAKPHAPGCALLRMKSFCRSYAKTLAEWRRRFLSMWPDVEALGFDIRFKRMWEYYLSYCEVGFQVGAINVSLVKLVPSR